MHYPIFATFSGPVDGHNCFIGKNHPSTTASPKQWILTSSSTDGKCHCTNFLLGGINLMASQNVLYVLANLDNLSSLGNIQEDCKAKGKFHILFITVSNYLSNFYPS